MTRRARRRRPGDGIGSDRGSVTTEMVVYSPLLFVLLLLGVQLAVWGLAQLAVQHTANHALQTTRIYGGTAVAGRADADAVLAQVGPRLVGEAQVGVSRTGESATVTVSGYAPRIVPFLRLRVSTSVTAPVERFRPVQARTATDRPSQRSSPGPREPVGVPAGSA